MIEQLNTAIVFYAFYSANGVGLAGLADVTVDVYRTGTQIVTGAATVEVGGGLYRYTLVSGSVTVEGEYVAIFKTADLTVAQRHIPALWSVGRAGIEFLDASIDNVTGEVDSVMLGIALESSIFITLVRGDDYLAEDQRALSFASTDWPDLTGAEIRMTMRRRREAFGAGSDPVWFSVTDNLTYRNVGGATQTVVFDLTHADTAAMIPGTSTGKWDIQATLPDASPSASPSPSPSAGPNPGNVITLAIGTATILEDQTRA
jgi:hypothetical protein